jgi:cephalosporin hydroxylase
MYSQKYTSYLKAYKDLMGNLNSSPKVIVEIGIANGGSLELWRRVFGDQVRIIGIDLNPQAIKLRNLGYEVLIADMGTSAGWNKLQDLLGNEKITILIVDGGHTNPQQIFSITRGIPLLAPGGYCFIEDLHSAFMADFGNPSRFSSWNFLAELSEDFQKNHFKVLKTVQFPKLINQIESFHFYLSLCAIKKRADENQLDATVDLGWDNSLMDYDHRWDGLEDADSLIRKKILGLVLVFDIRTRGVFRLRGLLAKLQSRGAFRRELRKITSKES